jgi:hypothetical protein
VWGAAIGALAAYDLWCHLNATDGDSLSEVARGLFQTHTPAGRLLFRLAVAGGSAWLLWHILDPADNQPR